MSTRPSAGRTFFRATLIGHLAGEAYGWPGALCPSWVLGTEYMRNRVRIRGQLVAQLAFRSGCDAEDCRVRQNVVNTPALQPLLSLKRHGRSARRTRDSR